MPAILLSLLMNRYVIGAIVGLGLLVGAYVKGYTTAAAKCHDAELRAEIAALNRDVSARDVAAAADRDMQSQLAADNIELQQKVNDYEADLAKRPDNRCGLSPADVDRLRGIGGR